jgi:uncharacterized protein (DUF1697 family)
MLLYIRMKINRFVALLRGVNVNPTKRVAMADLRELLTTLGCTDVRTVLNSGNAVFFDPGSSPGDLAGRIHSALAAKLALDIAVIVKSAQDFDLVVTGNPLLDIATDPARLIVTFTQHRSTLTTIESLTGTDWSPEALAVGADAIYMWCPNGTIASKVAPQVGQVLGELGTARNWSTVTKIHGLIRVDN